MGAWIKAGVEANYEKQNQNTSQYGTTTPNVSGQFTDAFNTMKGTIGANGLNATQQSALDRIAGAPTASSQVGAYNDQIGSLSSSLGRFVTQGPRQLGAAPTVTTTSAGATPTVNAATAAAPISFNAATARAPTAVQTATSANAGPVTARTGASYMGEYDQDYTDDVIDASLADFDNGAAEGFNALRAGNAGAFGNKRLGVSEGQFMGDAARGRGTLSANIRSEGFKTRANLGQQDANRFLSADTTNAENLLRNNQFNAGQQNTVGMFNSGQEADTDRFNAGQTNTVGMFNSGQTNDTNRFNAGQTNTVGMFNAGEAGTTNRFNADATNTNNRFNADMTNNRQQFDINSAYQNDAQAMAAIGAQAGLTQQQIGNIFTAQGIDMDAAQAMLAAGTIGQAQFEALLDAASAYNGSSFTQNANSSSSTYGVNTAAGFGL